MHPDMLESSRSNETHKLLTHSSHLPGFVSLKGELMLPAGPVRLRNKNEAMSFLVDKVDCNAVV